MLNGVSIATSNLVTGNLTVYGSINAPLVVASNATLTWDGQVNGQITAQPGATLNWRGNRLYTPLYIPSNAVLNITGPDNPQVFNWLTNAGTMNWIGGNFQVGACGWGIYNLAGATFNIECDATLSWWCGSEFVNNAGLIRKLSTTGTTTWNPLMYNTGVVDVEQGALAFQDYATNSVTGVYQCESNAALYFNGGTIFSGTYNSEAGAAIVLGGGTFTTQPPYYLDGAGIYEMTAGTLTLDTNLISNLQLYGGTILTGTNFQGGSITNLTLSGLSTGNSNYVTGQLTVYGSINGPVTVASNATLTWDGQVNAQITAQPGATLNWRGNRLYTPLYIPGNAVLNITGPDNPQVFNWLTNAGTMNWTGGNFQVGACGWGIYNLAGATFNIECDATLSWWCGTEFVNNAGLIRKLSTTGTTYWNPLVYNTGMIDVESGQLNFNNTFSQTGGAWVLGLNGLGNNGQMNFSGAAPLPASLTVNVNNGYILGLSNSFTLANYSSFAGTIGVTNLPVVGASWSLNAGSGALVLADTNLQAPTSVVITTPTNNQHFVIPVNIPITAAVSDPYAAVSAVQFYQGTNLLGQATSSPYTFVWNAAPPGDYVLSALAIDAAGGEAASAPVSITVYYDHVQTTNYTWTGAVSSDWFTAGNWMPNGVPGVLDTVTLANNGTINLGAGGVSINSLTNVSGTIQGTGTLTVTNSTL